jgi:methyltransferase-like protein/ubiquinone/menaquinone biosynthesis C-methylase UbiE
MQALENKPITYDDIPYESHAFVQSHPNRLATIAKLFGMKPAQLSHCKVLELGCAAGGNLIPMATTLPDAHFVGIDLSQRQVSEGQAQIKELGLKNIELKHVDLKDIDKSFGEFDYIVAHGIYSWVSEDLQEKILEICQKNLSANGVAYISYNTYPGWHFRGMIRDMMMYHAGHIQDAGFKAGQARALLDFLSTSVPTQDNAYGIMLQNELNMLRAEQDSYLLHEQLGVNNEPTYFYQFAERAARHGLQYLGEADFHTMLTSNFPKEVDETLKRISNEIVRTEQYMDFLRNRTFRQTLLVKQEVALNRNLTFENVQQFLIASPAKPSSANIEIQSNKLESFVLPNGFTLSTPQPLIKAAFQYLSEQWPKAVSFDDLLKTARTRIKDSQSTEQEKQLLGADLLTAYATNIVQFRTEESPFITTLSEKPKVSEIVRAQAKTRNSVTNQLHERIVIDVFSRSLISLLDGSRDKEAILDELAKLVKAGSLVVQKDGKDLKEGKTLREALRQAMNESLAKMEKAAVLIA